MRFAFAFVATLLFSAGCARDSVMPPARRSLQTAARTDRVESGVVPDQYFTQFSKDVSDARTLAQTLVEGNGGEVRHVFTELFRGALVAHLPAAAVENLRRSPGVEAVVQDVYAEEDATRTAPNWGLGRIDQHYLPTSLNFDYYQTGTGVHIYIVDSGIALLPSEFPRRGLSYSEPGLDPWQGCSDHGTQVASIAAGQTQGVATGATVHSVRVNDSTCELTHWQINAGLDWIAANAEYPAIVNISKRVDPKIFGWPSMTRSGIL